MESVALREEYHKLLPQLQNKNLDFQQQTELLREHIFPIVNNLVNEKVKEENISDESQILALKNETLRLNGIVVQKEDKFSNILPSYNTIDFKDTNSFKEWIEFLFDKMKNNPKIIAEEKITSIKDDNPEYRILREKEFSMLAELKENESYLEILNLQRKLFNLEKAMKSMKSAIESNNKKMTDEKREIMREKIQQAGEEYSSVTENLRKLESECDLYNEYLHIQDEIEKIKLDSGLDKAQDNLKESNKQFGAETKKSGRTFEEISAFALLQIVIPKYCTNEEINRFNDNNKPIESDNEVCVLLHSVTIGMYAAEVDYMLVRARKATEDEINKFSRPLNHFKKRNSTTTDVATFFVTDVLAIVECKANGADIIHNIPRMQTMLSWLTNDNESKDTHDKDSFYFDENEWKTNYFTKGIFNKPAVHYCTKTNTRWIFNDLHCFDKFKRDDDGIFRNNIFYLIKKGKIGVPAATKQKTIIYCIRRGITSDNVSSATQEQINEIIEWFSESFEDYNRTLRIVNKMQDVSYIRIRTPNIE